MEVVRYSCVGKCYDYWNRTEKQVKQDEKTWEDYGKTDFGKVDFDKRLKKWNIK